MKILAINGSHRKGKNTTRMLEITLEAAKSQGMKTELLEITDLNIKFCTCCNKCFLTPECSIQDDDMPEIYEKLKKADGILIGSPVYCANVTGRLKNFMDRSRPLHMTANYIGRQSWRGLGSCWFKKRWTGTGFTNNSQFSFRTRLTFSRRSSRKTAGESRAY